MKRNEARARTFAKTATSDNEGTVLGTNRYSARIDEGVFPGSVLYLLTSTSFRNAMLVEQADKARRCQISEYRRRWFHNEGSEKSTNQRNQRQELYNSARRSQTPESVVQRYVAGESCENAFCYIHPSTHAEQTSNGLPESASINFLPEFATSS